MRLLTNTIGRKAVVASTGVIMLLFLLAHLFGTISAFSGPDAINSYAETLRKLKPIFWTYRIVMTVVLFLHVTFAILVTLENWKAKPQRYAVKRMKAATFAGETMLWSGLLVLAFLVYHILQFALHATPDVVARTDAEGRFDVFTMMRESLRLVSISTVYTLSAMALFLHLSHGIRSVSQTVGALNEKTKPWFHAAGMSFSVFFLLGYGAVPALVMAGFGAFGR